MATIKQRGEAWELSWSIKDGGKTKQKRVSLGKISKREAQIALNAKELELRTGKPVLPNGLLFGEYSDEYTHWHRSEYPDSHYRTQQIIEQHLIPFFQFYPLDFIKIRIAEEYKTGRLNGTIPPNNKKIPKRATVAKELRTLKAMLNKAVYWEYIDFNPIQMLSVPKSFDSKAPRFYLAEEMEKIYQFAPYNWWYWKFYANTGVRLKESLQIHTRKHIGKESMKVESTEGNRTKSGKWRDIPLNESSLMSIERFNAKGGDLFPRVNPKSLSRAFSRVIHRSGIEEPFGSLHCLRHTYISHQVMNGKPLRLVQQLAGHAHITTTEKYAHLAPDYINEMGGMINL